MDLFSSLKTETPDESAVRPRVYSVSELTRLIKVTLEDRFPSLTVQGEISNLTRHSSGHIYFTLKDASSQIKCVIWRSQAVDLPITPADGMRVIVKGRIALYEKGGYYQITVSHVQPEGVGALQQAFELLKKKLFAEGLFDDGRKKPLPGYCGRIGIITSPTGAAVRDIVSVVRRRMPWAQMILAPVKVQGEGAAVDLVRAIHDFDDYGDVDVLIVGRGGGSLEDLWCFNDEQVARAIYDCSIPVVSAVGHEIDFTIADFVADVRAATPSAAAELVSVDQEELRQHLGNLRYTIEQNTRAKINDYRERLVQIGNRYAFKQPEHLVEQYRQQTDDLERRMRQAIVHQTELNRQRLIHIERQMRMLDPRNTLKRGYTIARQSGKVIQRRSEFQTGKPAAIEFYDGEAETGG